MLNETTGTPKKSGFPVITLLLIIGFFALLVFGGIGAIMTHERIPVGFGAVKTDIFLTDKDPDVFVDAVTKVKYAGINKDTYKGWPSYNPFTQSFIVYPITSQQVFFTRDNREGSSADESIVMRDKNGILMHVDVTGILTLDSTRLPYIAAKLNKMDFDSLKEKFLRGALRTTGSEISKNYTIIDLIGGKNNEASVMFQTYLNDYLDAYAMSFTQLNMPNVVPDNPDIEKNIQQTVAIQQETVKKEAEKKRIVVENEIMVANAVAKANSMKADADGIAYAKLTKEKAAADAEYYTMQQKAKGNLALNASLTEKVLTLKKLEVQQAIGSSLNAQAKIVVVPQGGQQFWSMNGILDGTTGLNK